MVTKSWIASFFEAHSPPEEGPLSTIDKWGKTLMNTYLKGFMLADFDILSDVGSKIREALDRIDAGTYGYCDLCGGEISEKRLKARPVTTLCIECKTRQEEEEKLQAG